MTKGYVTSTNPLVRLVYTSHLKPEYSNIDFVKAFVHTASETNPRYGIGGMLYVDDDLEWCEQILEGPRNHVERLFFGRRTFLKGKGEEGEERTLLPREQWIGGIKGDSKHVVNEYRIWAVRAARTKVEEEKVMEEMDELELDEDASEQQRIFDVWGMNLKQLDSGGQSTDASLTSLRQKWDRDYGEGEEDSGWKELPQEGDEGVAAREDIVVEEDKRKPWRRSLRR